MSTTLERISLASGALDCVGTLLFHPDSRDAVLIDPTDDPEPFAGLVRARGLNLRAVLLTHAHIDHAAGAEALAGAYGLAPRLHPADRPIYRAMADWGRQFGMHVAAPRVETEDLADGQTIEIGGGLGLRVIHTPGHSPGQVAFYQPELGLAVVGDTLFAGGVGRTDFPGGDWAALERSIRDGLYRLPDATAVVPGHGPETTIGREKRTNPYVPDGGGR